MPTKRFGGNQPADGSNAFYEEDHCCSMVLMFAVRFAAFRVALIAALVKLFAVTAVKTYALVAVNSLVT